MSNQDPVHITIEWVTGTIITGATLDRGNARILADRANQKPEIKAARVDACTGDGCLWCERHRRQS